MSAEENLGSLKELLDICTGRSVPLVGSAAETKHTLKRIATVRAQETEIVFQLAADEARYIRSTAEEGPKPVFGVSHITKRVDSRTMDNFRESLRELLNDVGFKMDIAKSRHLPDDKRDGKVRFTILDISEDEMQDLARMLNGAIQNIRNGGRGTHRH